MKPKSTEFTPPTWEHREVEIQIDPNGIFTVDGWDITADSLNGIKAKIDAAIGPKPQYHQSGIEMFGGCPEQYRRRYIERERTIPKAYLHVGTAVDKTVARNMRSKLDHGLLLATDEIKDLAKTFFDKKVDEEGIAFSKEERAAGEAKAKTAAIEKSRRLVLAHHALLAPRITPARGKNLIGDEWIGIGRRFTIELDGYDFELAGEIDLAEEKVIHDTKTSGASPSKDTAHDSLQLSMYALAKLACDGELPEQLRLDYLIDLKKSTKVMSLPTVRTKESLQPLLHRVQTMHELIQAGSFGFARADDWRCSSAYCSFWNSCKYAQHRPVSIGLKDYTAELSLSIKNVEANRRGRVENDTESPKLRSIELGQGKKNRPRKRLKGGTDHSGVDQDDIP